MGAISKFQIPDLASNPLQGVDTDPEVVDKVQSAMLEGEQTNVEYVTYSKSGTKFWSSLSIKPVLGDDGRLEHFVGADPDQADKRGGWKGVGGISGC